MWDLQTIKTMNEETVDVTRNLADTLKQVRVARAGTLHDEILEIAHTLATVELSRNSKDWYNRHLVVTLDALYKLATR